MDPIFRRFERFLDIARHIKRGICRTHGYPGAPTRRVPGFWLWSPPKPVGFMSYPNPSPTLPDRVVPAGYPGFNHPGHTSSTQHRNNNENEIQLSKIEIPVPFDGIISRLIGTPCAGQIKIERQEFISALYAARPSRKPNRHRFGPGECSLLSATVSPVARLASSPVLVVALFSRQFWGSDCDALSPSFSLCASKHRLNIKLQTKTTPKDSYVLR